MEKPDLLQGTLDMLILKVLSRESTHGFGICHRIQKWSDEVLSVGEGSLYPALYRLQDNGWIESEGGQVRKQPPGQVLQTNEGWPKVIGSRKQRLGPDVLRYPPDHADGVTSL